MTTSSRTIKQAIIVDAVGFLLSLALTGAAFLMVDRHLLTGWLAICSLALLAATQAIVQLVFFLHLGREGEPRWKLLVFDFMLVIITMLVVGSLWIMHNLDYRMMASPQQTDDFIIKDEGIHR